MHKNNFDLVVVTGPTASGKTSFAANLCYVAGGEIISADSRQVYRRMNIGTGKDYSDYFVKGRQIPWHLIDIAEPGYKYNIFEYSNDFLRVFRDITSRKILPVLCGGSGLYIKAATGSYNLHEVPPDNALRKVLEGKTLEELTLMLASMKKLHNKTDTDTKEHAVRAIEIAQFNPGKTYMQDLPIPNRLLFIGIRYDRQEERKRITDRLQKRLSEGLLDEVRDLLASGLQPEDLIYYGLEYKFVTMYLTGRLTYDEMFTNLNTAIHQFAKRQMTWFRKMEREGTLIHWINGELPMDKKINAALELMCK